MRGPESAPAADVPVTVNDPIDFDEVLASLVQNPTLEAVDIEAPALMSDAPVEEERGFFGAALDGLKGFWDYLGGGAMSDRERAQRSLAEASKSRYDLETGCRVL